jgi:long-subunit acyl-CoA synthetase (AMP-forming)
VLILVGDNEPMPELEREGVEFVRIYEALRQRASQTLLLEGSQPKASTLACVFFTSGSSGKPKGVMIEHRGVVRLVTNRGLPTRTAHLTNLAFDVSL